MSKDKSSQTFYLKLQVMKKMSFSFLVLLASFILAIQTFGQHVESDSIKSQRDSIKTEFNLSSEIVNKLDSKELVELIKHRESLTQEKELAKAKMNLPELTNDFTATIWSILLIIFSLSLFAIPYYFSLKKEKGRQQIILNMIEKDKDIPVELLAKPNKAKRPDSHTGIIWIMFGLSLSIVLFVLIKEDNSWTIGLIPMFIGIGYLISFKLNGSGKRNSEID